MLIIRTGASKTVNSQFPGGVSFPRGFCARRCSNLHSCRKLFASVHHRLMRTRPTAGLAASLLARRRPSSIPAASVGEPLHLLTREAAGPTAFDATLGESVSSLRSGTRRASGGIPFPGARVAGSSIRPCFRRLLNSIFRSTYRVAPCVPQMPAMPGAEQVSASTTGGGGRGTRRCSGMGAPVTTAARGWMSGRSDTVAVDLKNDAPCA